MENDSALRSIFGSTFSLSELNDENVKPTTPQDGYSRFGLNEKPPSHQMHTRVRRASSLATRPKRRRSIKSSALILFLFGATHGWIVNCHLPQHIIYPLNTLQIGLLLTFSGFLSIFAGFLVADSDTEKKNWASGFMRGYGAILGLIYLSRRLPPEANMTWVLVNPSLWYIADRTINGFLTASLVTFMGTASAPFICPRIFFENTWMQFFISMAGIGTAYFGTSLLAGNIGRAICKKNNR